DQRHLATAAVHAVLDCLACHYSAPLNERRAVPRQVSPNPAERIARHAGHILGVTVLRIGHDLVDNDADAAARRMPAGEMFGRFKRVALADVAAIGRCHVVDVIAGGGHRGFPSAWPGGMPWPWVKL